MRAGYCYYYYHSILYHVALDCVTVSFMINCNVVGTLKAMIEGDVDAAKAFTVQSMTKGSYFISLSLSSSISAQIIK